MVQLELRWHGHACFELTCKDFTVTLWWIGCQEGS